jgi:hypothetical protein
VLLASKHNTCQKALWERQPEISWPVSEYKQSVT